MARTADAWALLGLALLETRAAAEAEAAPPTAQAPVNHLAAYVAWGIHVVKLGSLICSALPTAPALPLALSGV